jgi:hypothetical protein
MSQASAGTQLPELRRRVLMRATRSFPDPTRRSIHLPSHRPLRLSPKFLAGPTILPLVTLPARPGTPRRPAKRLVPKSQLRPTATTVSTRSLVRPEAVAAALVAVVRASPAVVAADVAVVEDVVVPEVAAATARLLAVAVDVAVDLAAMATLLPGPRRDSGEELQ